MKGIRDWVFSQLLSKSLASSRPLSGSGGFFHQGPVDDDSNDPGISISFFIYFCNSILINTGL